jgi:hypothetical protein
MQRRSLRPGVTTTSALFAVAVLVAAVRLVAAQECDVSICQGNPCTITGVHHLTESCDLDFGDTDVTIGPTARLIWPGPDSSGTLAARSMVLQGSLEGTGLALLVTVDEDFTSGAGGRGRILVRRKTTAYGAYIYSTPADVSIVAGGNVILAGTTVRLNGAWAYLTIQGANVQIDSTIMARAYSDDFANIEINALAGSISTSKRLTARGVGVLSGGSISLNATGDLTTGNQVAAVGGRQTGFTPAIFVNAGGNVTLHSAKLTHQGGDEEGHVEVEAGGNITLLRHILARGRTIPGPYGQAYGGIVKLTPGAAGVVVIPSKIDASCTGGCVSDGSIQIATGCYTDLTGARLRATPAGSISIGCTCSHPVGSTACDGGCLGLEQASFDPPVNTNLPPCS